MKRLLLTTCLTVAALAGSAMALQAPPPPFDRLVERLDSDDYQTRVQAMQDIGSSLSGVHLRQIEAQLKKPTLTLEQRTRLLLAAESVFMREPRAAIGLSWAGPNGVPNARGVTITGCIEGFDSARVLRPGDIVRAIDGAPVEDRGYSNADIRSEIVSHDPGDELHLSIIRNGEPMQVVCRVGKFTDLPQANDLQMVLQGAWKKRLARMQAMAPAQPTLTSSLIKNGWTVAETEFLKAASDERSVYEQIVRAAGMDPRTVDYSVVVPLARIGGEARGEPTGGSSDFDMQNRERGPNFGPRDFQRGRRGGRPIIN